MLIIMAASGLIGSGKQNFVGKDMNLEVAKTGQSIWGGQGEMVSPKQI